MAELPSGTVTLPFTDIESSTRLLERLGAGYVEVLREHRRLLRAAFAQFDGHEVSTEGDSFFVAFARASDAVAAGRKASGRSPPIDGPTGWCCGCPWACTLASQSWVPATMPGWRCIGRRGSARLGFTGSPVARFRQRSMPRTGPATP